MSARKETRHEIRTGIEAFAARYPFPLDLFQREAISHLANDRSVLVTAPTGTGKTIVAEYAIWRALQRHQRVIYTTPLKALSNQKYHDFGQEFGPGSTGLLTGDIVEHSKAPILVMTTEVYRNMLLDAARYDVGGAERDGSSPLLDMGAIIFDEMHYLSDPERGPVWEEAIICSPKHMQLVGLSATVSNAEELADWISRVHRPISLVVHQERAVPLEHYYVLDGALSLVQDAAGLRVQRFPRIGGEARFSDHIRRQATQLTSNRRAMRDSTPHVTSEHTIATREGQEPGVDGAARFSREDQSSRALNRFSARRERRADRDGELREERPVRVNGNQRQLHQVPTPGELLTILHDGGMLPCLYFLPGRRIVEEAAMSAAFQLFTTEEQQVAIRTEFERWRDQLTPADRALPQVHSLGELLPRGIAFHHAGLLPMLKVLVERLFAQGYLCAVFATDTLALGINMPARSVVVGSLSKFDGQQMRLLTPNEYSQLTGRAGRRGKDVYGAAIIPYSPWEPFEAVFQQITGPLLPVTSSFVIRYNSVLNLWRPGDISSLERLCASSLRQYERFLEWERHELERQRRRNPGNRNGKKARRAQSAMTRDELANFRTEWRTQFGGIAIDNQDLAELEGTIITLREEDFINASDHLTLKGHLLRHIFHPAGMILVEMLLRGGLDTLSPAEIAEIGSWFTFDSDRRLHNQLALPDMLLRLRRELRRIEDQVRDAEDRSGLRQSPQVHTHFYGLALSWANEVPFNVLLQHIDLAEGDILTLLNQTIDLVQQLHLAVKQVLQSTEIWSPQSTAYVLSDIGKSRKALEKQERKMHAQHEYLKRLLPLLASASRVLQRGIVIQSRTLPSMAVQFEDETTSELNEEDSIEMEEVEPE